MLRVLEEPAVRARVTPISVATYHRMGEAGDLTERTELIRGAVIEKMSQSPQHASIVEMIREALAPFLPEEFILRQEKPLTLADSEPEPDLAVVSGPRDAYFAAHPSTAELVIEVCVSSESIDRIKLGVYAEAGVMECWLILAEDRVIERHTEPVGDRYAKVERSPFTAPLASTVFPAISLPPATLAAR